jgi:hypothetical protein
LREAEAPRTCRRALETGAAPGPLDFYHLVEIRLRDPKLSA